MANPRKRRMIKAARIAAVRAKRAEAPSAPAVAPKVEAPAPLVDAPVVEEVEEAPKVAPKRVVRKRRSAKKVD